MSGPWNVRTACLLANGPATRYFRRRFAALAQPVEHVIRNDGVACSNHAGGTTFFVRLPDSPCDTGDLFLQEPRRVTVRLRPGLERVARDLGVPGRVGLLLLARRLVQACLR